MSYAIQAHHISKAFGEQVVLRNVCLDIEPAQSLVMMGQSGTGKSVFLKCLLGLIPYDKGKVVIGPYALDQESDRIQAQRFKESGVVFQSYALFDGLPLWENVAFCLTGTDRRAHAISLLEQVGIDHTKADLYPSELSGGMKRRASIARAIALNPTYLFFDEPVEGLDPIFSATISHLIREVITRLKATSITITHNVQSAMIIGDRVVLLDEGEIVWQGTPHEMQNTSFPLMHQFVHGQG